jgi:adenosine deaminase
MTFIAGLPKAELHLHIEGTLEPELRLALAERNGMTLPYDSIDAIRATYTFDSLSSFLTVYYAAMEVLITEDDFHDLAWAYLTKAAAQNVRHVEMFFDPQAHTGRGVEFATVIRGLRRAVVAARKHLNIHADLIMCFLGDLDPGWAMATLMESVPYRDWILGVGLDSDERGNPPVKFAAVFAKARELGYFLTMHCDVDQDDTHENIKQAITVIGVDRVDHGSNAAESDELVALLLDRRIGLTNCPLSNGFVTSDTKSKEIGQLLDAGVRCTVNSDDPAYFGGYVAENIETLQQALSLDEAGLVALQRNAFEISWLPTALRERFLTELDAYGRS